MFDAEGAVHPGRANVFSDHLLYFLRPCDLLWGRRRQQGRTQPVKNNEHFYPYNNGLAEGSVNKIKVIKRTMYGRNSFELLKDKVLFYELFHVEFN